MDVSSAKVIFDWMKDLPEKEQKTLFSRINMLRDKGRRMLSNTPYLKRFAGEEELFEISVSTRGKEYRLITWIGTDDCNPPTENLTIGLLSPMEETNGYCRTRRTTRGAVHRQRNRRNQAPIGF